MTFIDSLLQFNNYPSITIISFYTIKEYLHELVIQIVASSNQKQFANDNHLSKSKKKGDHIGRPFEFYNLKGY